MARKYDHHARLDKEQPYRKLYRTKRWSDLRQRVFARDRFTCRECKRIEIDTSKLIAHHSIPHKGDITIFWKEDDVICVCKTCHDGHIQRGEKRGIVIGCDVDGRPLDRNHPWQSAG